MSVSCSAFRRLVEAALVGRPDPSRLSGLSFHEHVLTCAACRELLEGEEALEVLLASWPCPELPAELSARLIERLREARRLEELLDLDAEPALPDGLARRVLEGVARSRARSRDGADPGREHDRIEARLDAWLDLAGQVDVPVGLSARMVRALRPPLRDQRPHPQLTRSRAWYRAAVALIATFSLAGLWRFRQRGPSTGLELAMAVPPEELLSALPALENWEVLFTDDDPELATGMDFTAEDEVLLELVGVDLSDEPDDGDSNG